MATIFEKCIGNLEEELRKDLITVYKDNQSLFKTTISQAGFPTENLKEEQALTITLNNFFNKCKGLSTSQLQRIFQSLYKENPGLSSLKKTDECLESEPTLKPVTKLPRHSPFFVGRQEQIERICGQLTEPQVLQIRGLGGIGKTALAIKVGYTIKDSFPDGVIWFFTPDYTIERFINKLNFLFRLNIPLQNELEEKKDAIQLTSFMLNGKSNMIKCGPLKSRYF